MRWLPTSFNAFSNTETPDVFLSACIELLFADDGSDLATRVRAAGRAGVPALEFWGWRNKDVDALAAVARSAGVAITSLLADPPGRLVDRATHADFLRALPESCAVANKLGARSLIVLSGDRLPEVADDDQRQALSDVLSRAARIAAQREVMLVLEPLNTRVDHPDSFLDRTEQALAIIRDVDSSHLKLLYDVYHSVAMHEDPAGAVGKAGPLIGHVHVADFPGRHEPGTGQIDWQRTLAAIRECGYDGPIGLEYVPSGDSAASLSFIHQAVEGQGQAKAIPIQPAAAANARRTHA
jgi:hydroxypyruvate isomerase